MVAKLRYGLPGDFAVQPRARYSYDGGAGGSRLTPQDLRAIVHALEQLDWVQFCKAQMASNQPGPGEVAGPGAAENVAAQTPKLKLSPLAGRPAPEPPVRPLDDTFKPPARFRREGEPEKYHQRHAHLSEAIEVAAPGSAERLDFSRARNELYRQEQDTREQDSDRVRRYALANGCSMEAAAARLGYQLGAAIG